MFETYSNAKVVIPDGLRDPDEQAWWYVKLSLHIPWFYVTCDIDYGNNEVLTQMLLITQVKHLVGANKSKTFKIKHVDLVIPQQMNQEGNWKMSPLSEIWVGREPGIEHYQEAFIFVLENGKEYIDSGLHTERKDLLDITKIFSQDHGL